MKTVVRFERLTDTFYDDDVREKMWEILMFQYHNELGMLIECERLSNRPDGTALGICFGRKARVMRVSGNKVKVRLEGLRI